MDCTNEIATSHYHVFWWTTACSLGNIYSPALLFSIANRNRTVCVHIYTVYIHDISDRSACQASIPSWCPTHNQNTILSMYKMYTTRSTFSFYFLLLSITSYSLLSALSLCLSPCSPLSLCVPARTAWQSEWAMDSSPRPWTAPALPAFWSNMRPCANTAQQVVARQRKATGKHYKNQFWPTMPHDI